MLPPLSPPPRPNRVKQRSYAEKKTERDLSGERESAVSWKNWKEKEDQFYCMQKLKSSVKGTDGQETGKRVE